MFASPAFAQAAGGAQSTAGFGSYLFVVPYIAIFAIFYFLLIRPQQRRAKMHQAMIQAAKKGDTVVTGGGLVGKVTKVEDAHVEIELAPNVRVRAVKSTLADITPLGGAKPAND